MSKYQEVTIEVDGIKVKGQITHRSEPDISITISSPYQGLSNGLHIPYFSRPIHSFLTEYGDRTAENLLKYLYELGSYMEENIDFITMQMCMHFHDGDYSSSDSQDRFFDSTFPFTVPIGTRDEVLRQLK